MENKINSTDELLSDDKPWEYDCDGVKTHKGNFTRPWTEEDEQVFVGKYNNKNVTPNYLGGKK